MAGTLRRRAGNRRPPLPFRRTLTPLRPPQFRRLHYLHFTLAAHFINPLQLKLSKISILRGKKPSFFTHRLHALLRFSLCASSSITFTAFHGFHGDPVTFISSLKSIPACFFPPLATAFAIQIILCLIILALLAILLLAYKGIALLGFELDYNTSYFLIIVMLMSVLLVGICIYLQVQWSVSTAVVVVESKWGFAPLKRSSYLVKGMRGVVLSLVLLFAVLVGLLSVWYYSLIMNAVYGGLSGWGALQMVLYACLIALLSLYGLAANAVLFVYSRASHGETAAFQGDEENMFDWVLMKLWRLMSIAPEI